MSQPARAPKDRTSLVIAVVLHVVLLGAVGFWMHKTGKLEALKETILKLAQGDKKDKPDKEIKAMPPKQPPRQAPLPKINEGLPPPSTTGGGTRRAVAGDAPEAVGGGSFFVDTRTQVAEPGAAGRESASAANTNRPTPPRPPPSRPAESRSLFDLAGRTNVGTAAKLLQERASAVAVQDSFGAEQISRSGTSSAADVVTKITGASVVEGKHAVIRGLADRYNITTLNGAEVPSSDPYRKSVQVDIFSADVLEKVVTTKSYMPDQPGTSTGGNIDIVTKSFPARPFFNFSAETSYNEKSNLRDDFLVAPDSKIDPIGLGTRPRDLPTLLRNYPIGAQYPEVPQFMNSRRTETQEQAAERREQAELAQAMLRELGVTDFGPHTEKSPLNSKFAFSAGQTTHLFDRPLGVFVAGNYTKRFAMIDDGIQGRYYNDLSTNRIMSEMRAAQIADYGGSVNLAYLLARDQELSFNFLYNNNREDEARALSSQYINPASPMSGFQLEQLQSHYTERELQVYQLRGRHRIESLADTRPEWLVSYSSTAQDEPDYRFYHVLIDANTNNNFASNQPQPDRPARYFRELQEDNLNMKLDDATPFRVWRDLTGELKMGLYSSSSERDFFERTYLYRDDARPGYRYVQGPPNDFLTESNLSYSTTYGGVSSQGVGRTNYNFARYLATAPGGNNQQHGTLEVYAGYLMAEVPLHRKLRVIGGARYETTDLQMAGWNGVTNVNTSIVQQDLLPAVAVVLSLRSNMNLRFNWGQTIARPTFREIAPYRSYDTTGDEIFQGNPNLKISAIDNYDVRWEWFPRPSEVISVGYFYKYIKDPIEKYSESLEGGEYTYKNFPEATVSGLEFEARKGLEFLERNLKNFSIGANIALINSSVPLSAQDKKNKGKFATDERPLFDQSPYVINLDLTYDNRRSGTTASLLANLTGERLYIVNGASEDIYEHPPTMLDFVLSQRLNRTWRLKFTARNLLDSQFKRTVGSDANGLVYSSYTRGRTFALSLAAEF